jgi:hypothetical protein
MRPVAYLAGTGEKSVNPSVAFAVGEYGENIRESATLQFRFKLL